MVDRLLNVLIALAVVGLAAVVVHRELSGSPERPPHLDANAPPVEVELFPQVLASSIPLGAVDAPVQIVLFEDLECPFCKSFHADIVSVLEERFNAEVSWHFVHFPLPQYRFARPAAEALECAVSMAKGREFVSSAFALQDSFGLLSWTEVALRAGVADGGAFEGCLKRASLFSRIDEGLDIGGKIGVTGTPTVLVNGLRFVFPPTLHSLEKVIDSILTAGR